MGVAHLKVLPMVGPPAAALLVLLALLPALLSLWRRPQPPRFATAAAYACLTGFWLGYHVHEKAILPVGHLLPRPRPSDACCVCMRRLQSARGPAALPLPPAEQRCRLSWHLHPLHFCGRQRARPKQTCTPGQSCAGHRLAYHPSSAVEEGSTGKHELVGMLITPLLN